MYKIITSALIIYMVLAYNRNAFSTSGTKKDPSLHADSFIQRIVCFKFKRDATLAAIQQHMRGFAGLKDSIPYILSYQVGPTVRGDLSKIPAYNIIHYTTFRSEEEIRLYSVHPVYLRFIEQNKSIWENVLVVNSTFRP